MKKNVIIIGGGAIGLCAAYYLHQQGASVTVVDKGEMGEGSSHHNAGYLSPSHFAPLAAPGLFWQGIKWMFNPRSPLLIKPRLDPNFLSWVWKFKNACDEKVLRRAIPTLRDLLLESLRLTEALSSLDGMNFDFVKNGQLILYRTSQGKVSLEHEARLADEYGVEARLLDRSQLQQLDPAVEYCADGGVYFPGDAHLIPASFVKNLSAHLKRCGIQLIPNCEVTGFEKSNGHISAINTNKGKMQADEYVLAGGAWSPGLIHDLGIKMFLQAGKGYSITVKDPPVKPGIPSIFSERRVAITPFPDSLRFAGTMEFSGLNLTIRQERVTAILDSIPLYYGNVQRPDLATAQVWCGMRPVTPDGMPYIGRFKQYSNLIATTGHAMVGISLAAVTGKLVMEIVTGKPSFDLTLLNPNRYD
ncbi:MAG: NAD(P)/FAD-dependent oxidoreductase [Bacteroidota bacterium]